MAAACSGAAGEPAAVDAGDRRPADTVADPGTTADATAQAPDTTADANVPAAGMSVDTSTPEAAPVAYAIPPRELDDGFIEFDDAALVGAQRFAGHVAFVHHGVELGVWTEPEGVIALLRARLGEIPRSSIEGLDLVLAHSGSALLRLAAQLADDSTVAADERAELHRLLAELIPSVELLDELATLGDESGDDAGRAEPAGFRRAAPGSATAQADDCVRPTVSSFPFVDRVAVDCWKMIVHNEHRGAGSGHSRLRVVYPEGRDRQAETTMEALITTVRAGHAWSDANPDTTVLVIPQDVVSDEGDEVWGAATPVSNRHCAVTVGVDAALGRPYQQMVAHEQIHCLQYADFGDVLQDWYVEGGAEYFSHVIYPDGGNERDTVDLFLATSLWSAFPTMSYEAWVWWQHLSNLSSPPAVWDLHHRMSQGNPVDVLAGVPGMAETLQSFTIDLLTVGVPTHGDPIAPVPYAINAGRIASVGTNFYGVDRFVAARFGVAYAERHLFEQTDHTTTDGLMQMAVVEERLDRGAWRGLPPEVRSSCDADVNYAMAATTISPERHIVDWSVDLAEEYGCDPCLGGTWLVDNDSFRETIMSFVSAGIPAGMGFTMELVGPYYVRFDGSGAGNAWRQDWQIVSSGSAGGTTMEIIHTISSIESFEYGADGEHFSVWSSIVDDYRSRMEMPGLPVGASLEPGQAVVNVFGVEGTVGVPIDGGQSTAGSYTCDRHTLAFALEEAPSNPIRLTRTTDIPEPPTVLPAD